MISELTLVIILGFMFPLMGWLAYLDYLRKKDAMERGEEPHDGGEN